LTTTIIRKERRSKRGIDVGLDGVEELLLVLHKHRKLVEHVVQLADAPL
jgi:hypothetical protein